MRKRKKGRKFSRKRNQRRALLKALVSALILRERIQTTETKAKETSRLIEKFITRARQVAPSPSEKERGLGGRAKKEDLATRRYLLRFFSSKIVKKLISEIAPRYKERKGGCTRIIKLGPRKSDGAKIAIIELVN